MVIACNATSSRAILKEIQLRTDFFVSRKRQSLVPIVFMEPWIGVEKRLPYGTNFCDIVTLLHANMGISTNIPSVVLKQCSKKTSKKNYPKSLRTAEYETLDLQIGR